MFSWIARMFDSVAGRIDNTVRNWVHDLVNGLYGFLHVIFSAVAREWVGMVKSAQNFANTFFFFAHSVWSKFYNILRVIVPRIVNEYRTLIHDVTAYAQTVYGDLVRGLAMVTSYAAKLFNEATAWVIQNVYDPLLRALTSAWNWITHEGATLWGYITHPDALAQLIFDSLLALLEREAWAVADKLGRFAISLVFRNLRQFAALVEDILSAIL